MQALRGALRGAASICDFLLLSPIGSGSIGMVYKAIDLPLNRYLALKILPRKLSANPEFVNNFSREARSAAVNHQNVAQVYSFGEYDDQYYIAMELLEHGSLDDRISKLGKLPEEEVLSIGIQVASALRAAWGHGVLHRDVKPGNILFNEDEVPKIVDFGLARSHGMDGESPSEGFEHVWGTPYYIAPEKLRGQSEDFRSDMYSLGATLFHAAAGRPPFDAATTGEVITKHVTQPALLRTYAPDGSRPHRCRRLPGCSPRIPTNVTVLTMNSSRNWPGHRKISGQKHRPNGAPYSSC